VGRNVDLQRMVFVLAVPRRCCQYLVVAEAWAAGIGVWLCLSVGVVVVLSEVVHCMVTKPKSNAQVLVFVQQRA